MADKLKPGDFTGLADNYSKFRPGYAGTVLDAVLDYCAMPYSDIHFADVGAGTGIWTRLVTEKGVAKAWAVEPNSDMRSQGQRDSEGCPISWQNGTGTDTGLPSESVDLLTMASSFHWVDYNQGIDEFMRVLKPGGTLCVLWNPRYIEVNPLLVEIEASLREFAPHLKRVSSGNSGRANDLDKMFLNDVRVDGLLHLEGFHSVRQTPEEYVGVWWSVNDIRSQAGEEAFGKFMDFVTEKVADLDYIETTYRTRAWVVKKPLK